MNHSDTVDRLLAEFSHRLGFPPVELSEHGTCAFDYHELTIVLEVPAGGDALHLYASVMQLPPTGRQRLFERLLKLNLYGRETGGASFALDEQENAVVLCYSQSIEQLDHRRFANVIENFSLTLQRWHLALAHERFDDDGDTKAPTRPFEHPGIRA